MTALSTEMYNVREEAVIKQAMRTQERAAYEANAMYQLKQARAGTRKK